MQSRHNLLTKPSEALDGKNCHFINGSFSASANSQQFGKCTPVDNQIVTHVAQGVRAKLEQPETPLMAEGHKDGIHISLEFYAATQNICVKL